MLMNKEECAKAHSFLFISYCVLFFFCVTIFMQAIFLTDTKEG